MSLDNGFGGVIQIDTVPGCKMKVELFSVVGFFGGDTRGFPGLLQSPSAADRSRITEPLTRTAAAVSQYCL